MGQLGRRAVALDVSLMSKQPGDVSLTFESRAAQVVLILLLSAGEARGMNSICASVLDLL